jgi:RNA polymerase sigma-70 factor (ECF subfamily)
VDEQKSAVLLARWQEGDSAAAELIFERYVRRLVGLAKTRLSSKMQRRVDAEDVVQSAG